MANLDVLGFVEVDQPRVFIRMNGGVKSLAVGQSIQGIEVVKIKATVVEL